jgi:hypothetical protein
MFGSQCSQWSKSRRVSASVWQLHNCYLVYHNRAACHPNVHHFVNTWSSGRTEFHSLTLGCLCYGRMREYGPGVTDAHFRYTATTIWRQEEWSQVPTHTNIIRINITLRGAFAKPLLPWKNNRYYTLWVCVIALFIQHAKRMRRIYCHLWPVWLYHIFPHYLINITIFGKKSYWT